MPADLTDADKADLAALLRATIAADRLPAVAARLRRYINIKFYGHSIVRRAILEITLAAER